MPQTEFWEVLVLSKGNIVAAVTIAPDTVGGDMPVLFAQDREDLERLASLLSNIMHATVHDLGNGTVLVVQR